MPNIYVGTINAEGPTNALVGTTSGTIIAETIGRVGLTLVNISSGTIYLAFQGLTATLNAGTVLTPNGGSFTMDEYNYSNGTINGISTLANSIVAVQQFIR